MQLTKLMHLYKGCFYLHALAAHDDLVQQVASDSPARTIFMPPALPGDLGDTLVVHSKILIDSSFESGLASSQGLLLSPELDSACILS
jgi:hypothetical protein